MPSLRGSRRVWAAPGIQQLPRGPRQRRKPWCGKVSSVPPLLPQAPPAHQASEPCSAPPLAATPVPCPRPGSVQGFRCACVSLSLAETASSSSPRVSTGRPGFYKSTVVSQADVSVVVCGVSSVSFAWVRSHNPSPKMDKAPPH